MTDPGQANASARGNEATSPPPRQGERVAERQGERQGEPEAERWQIPTDRVIVLSYGVTRRFEVEGRCIAQGPAGILFEPISAEHAFAQLGSRAQMIPYHALQSVRVLLSEGDRQIDQHRHKARERKRRVTEELKDILKATGGEGPGAGPEGGEFGGRESGGGESEGPSSRLPFRRGANLRVLREGETDEPENPPAENPPADEPR